MKELDIRPCVHILDCTKVLANLDNKNYENSSVVKIDRGTPVWCMIKKQMTILFFDGRHQ